MNRYTATFADGTAITRSSERPYTVAWRARWVAENGLRIERTGFAVSREKAKPERPSTAWGYPPGRRKREAQARDRSPERQYHVEFAPTVLN